MFTKCPKCQADNPDTLKFCGECGTPLPSPKVQAPATTETFQTPIHELTTGSTFAGRYQIIEELGHGGMGKVYKVFDTDIKEKIALKLLRPDIALDKETVERFSNELKLARKVRHKNICGMFDLGKAEGTTFITMEFVPGQDLKKLIRQTGQLGAGRAVSIANQVCEGLAEAHHLGVIHRDLKPQNIMVDEDGNARIMDFGIARSLRGKGITGAGVMIGTPEYMSPEQVEGKEADQRSDIYSLGIILYEMLTGRVPFEGDTPFTVGVKHKSEIPKDPRQLNTQIPPDLDRLVLKCLEKDKAKRYQTANELHADLEKVEQGLPTTERITPARKPFTSKEITVKFSLKKLLFPALALVIVVIAAGLILWRVLPARKSVAGPPSIAVLPLQNLSGDPQQDYFSDGLSDELIGLLTKVKELHVAGRTSSFAFKGKNASLADIGRELHVGTVLTGSVRRSGDRLRVSAQLVNIADGYEIWAESYDRTMTEVFAVQDDIAGSVVAALKVKLLPQERPAASQHRTSIPEAYTQFLLGKHFYSAGNQESWRRAVDAYESALRLDPGYAAAWAGLAVAENELYGNTGTFAEMEGWLQKARLAAEKAISLDPTLADSYSARGLLRNDTFPPDWTGAQADFEEALALDNGNADAHMNFSKLLVKLGDLPKAIAEVKKAIDLDPLSGLAWRNLGGYLNVSSDLPGAQKALARAIEINPEDAFSHSYFGVALLRAGNPKAAIVEFARTLPYGRLMGLAMAEHKLGHSIESQKALDELIAKYAGVAAFQIAEVYAWRGEKDKAFEWFDRAYAQRDPGLTYLKCDFLIFAPTLRSDPRFQELLRRMKFPAVASEK